MSKKYKNIQQDSKKKWHIKDLRAVHPITESQVYMFRAAEADKNIIASGTAGTGKTYLAMYLALRAILDENSHYKRIRIVRSAVDTRDIGFKPGTEEEKVMGYEAPYRDICHELIGRYTTYDDMKDVNLILFNVTSNIRGTTWRNEIVILEEVENLNFHEIDSCITRMGKGSKLIIAGDIKQTDLIKTNRDTSGMNKLLHIANKMPSFEIIEFDVDDIVRSDLVKEWIVASENVEDGG